MNGLVLPDVPLIYDTVDLHFLRANAERALETIPLEAGDARRVKTIELAMALAADVTVVVAESEGNLLRELVPGVRTYTIPTIHHVSRSAATAAGRSGLLFVGNFNHRPNVDAIEWLTEAILPLILERSPTTFCRVVGSNMPATVRTLARPGLEIVGHVRDIAPLYAQTRLSIAPLRYGAGIKGKVGESAAFGVPIVGTPIAFDGFDFRDGVDCRVAEDPDSFVSAIDYLLKNDAAWLSMSQSAKISLNLRCGPGAVETTLKQMFFDLNIAASIS